MWWSVVQADHEMRAELLRQTHMLARTLKFETVRALTGTPADLQNPEYLRLKEEFAAVRASIPQCRAIYLMGRPSGYSAAAGPDAAAPNAEVCFLVGVGTDHDVRPGVAVCKGLRRAFETGTSFVQVSLADVGDEWISGMAPLTDPLTGDYLAVLGMNMDVRDWHQGLLRAALPPALFTLGLAALQMLGVVLSVRRSRGAAPPRWMRQHELALIIAAGLLLTGDFTWMAYCQEVSHMKEQFVQLVALRTRVISSTLRSVHRMELESLARLYASNGESAAMPFQQFSSLLTKNPAVHLWALVPAVSAADKADFEARARAAGAKDFTIWQKDAHGRRVPASGRDVYFPAWQVAPMAGHDLVVGYDLGSDPQCREALEAAARDGLPTASEPVTMVQETSDLKGLMIFQPVFTAGDAPRLRGFAVADLSLESMLLNLPSDDSAIVGVSILHKDAPPEILSKPWKLASHLGQEISVQRPVLAFGKVFAVTATPGPAFLRTLSQQRIWWAAITGLVLTAAFAISFGTQLKRRSILERLVGKRTLEIQDSAVRFRQLAEATFEGVAIVDNGILLDGNRRFAEVHGYDLAEMLGRPILEFVAPQSRHLVAKGGLKSNLRSHAVYGLRKDGSIFPTETSTRTGPWLGRALRIITIRDQSEAHAERIVVQALRVELVHAQRLALVSEVSAGIIHQLSQPLSAIGIHLAMLPKQQGDAMEIINDVEADVVRMRDIVSHLRALINPSQAHLACHDLNALVVKVLPLLQVKAGLARMQLELDLHQSLPAIRADAIQISQVIFNLMHNAIEASVDTLMERRVVLISTRPHAGHGVELCVRDSGVGLSPEALEHIFTPFYTTKANGLGIGLRLCQTIVHAHDGHIEGYNNADGPGTTFRIKLPLNPRS